MWRGPVESGTDRRNGETGKGVDDERGREMM